MNKIIILSLVLGCVYGGEVAYGRGNPEVRLRLLSDKAKARQQAQAAHQGNSNRMKIVECVPVITSISNMIQSVL